MSFGLGPCGPSLSIAVLPTRLEPPDAFLTLVLVLLRHRNGWAPVVLCGALQHGHRARVVARATIRCRRIVAIEFATCRSGRTGGASGSIVLGNARRRELFGGIAGG